MPFVLKFAAAGSSTQTVSPSGLASAEAFGTTVATPGPVAVAPTGLASGEAFGTAVATVTPWIRRTAGIAARNGTTSHTLTFAAADAGSLLVVIVAGSVTHAATGWTEQLQPVGAAELSVFTKTATAGESTITVTHNGSNYPVAWVAYEFYTGSSYTGGTGQNSGTTWPTLTGLTGTNLVFGAIAVSEQTGNAAFTSTATAPWTEDVDTATTFSTTDGIALHVAYQPGVTASSATPDLSTTAATTAQQRVVFAIAVAVPSGPTNQTVSPTGIADPTAVGNATITSLATVSPGGVGTLETFGSTTVIPPAQAVTGAGAIASGEAWSTGHTRVVALLAMFEGQTNGTAATVVNSDDFGDFPLSAIVTSGAITYDTTRAAHGSLSFKHAYGATSQRVNYNWGSTGTSWMVSIYLWRNGHDSVESQGPFGIYSSANVGVGRLQTTATGIMKWQDTVGTLFTFTNAIPTAQWVRLDAWGTGWGTASSTVYVGMFAGDSVTPIEEKISSAGNHSTNAAQQIGWGRMSSAAARDEWFDSVRFAIGAAGPAGPFVPPTTVQTVSPTAIDDSDVWGAAQINQSITLTGIPSAEAFGTAVERLTMTTPGIVSAEAFGAATASPGSTTVSPAGIPSAEAFGSTTVTPGAYPVSAAGNVGSAEAFGAATVGRGTVSVAPAGVPTGEAFGSATLTPGAVILAPAGVASLEALGSATVSLGGAPGQNVSPAGIAGAEAFGTATASPGAATVSPTGLASGEAFGAVTVTAGGVTVSPSGLASAEAWGGAVVGQGGVVVQPPSIGTGEAFGAVSATPGPVTVAPTGVPTGEAFGVATTSRALAPTGVPTAEAFGSATLGATAAIAPAGVPSGEAFGSASVHQSVTAAGIPSAEAFGAATALPPTATVSPTGMPTGESWGVPFSGSGFRINPGLVPVGEAFGAATVTARADVAPAGTGSAEAFGPPTISTSTTASPGGIPTGEAWGSATITRGAITPTGVPSAEAWGTATASPGPATVAPAGIPSQETVSAPLVAQNVAPGGVGPGEAWGTASVARGAVSVAPGGLPSGEAWGNPGVTPVSTLGPAAVATSESWGVPRISHRVSLGGLASAEAWGAASVGLGAAPEGRDIDVLATLGERRVAGSLAEQTNRISATLAEQPVLTGV